MHARLYWEKVIDAMQEGAFIHADAAAAIGVHLDKIVKKRPWA